MHIRRICRPRVWGAEAPSSQPCDTKGREAGFCIAGRNLLWQILEALYNKSRFERACATARKRKFLRKSKLDGQGDVEAASKGCGATLA